MTAAAQDAPPDPAQAFAPALVETAQDALFAVDPAGKVLAWSWGASTMYGYAPGEAIGQAAMDLLAFPEDREEGRAAIEECRATGSAVRACRRRRKDGSELLVQEVLRWFPQGGGFVAVSDSDVTDARRLEGELSEQVWSLTGSQAFLQGVMDATVDHAIIALALDGRVEAWNAGARNMLGHDAAGAKGHVLSRLVTSQPSAAQAVDALVRDCLAVGHAEAELELERTEGQRFPARLSITVRRDEFASPLGCVVVATDLTQARRAEEARLLAQQRLAEIRRLEEVNTVRNQLLNAASHELGTPITPMKIQIKILEGLAGGDERQRKAVETLGRNLARLERVVTGILEVARVQAGTLTMSRAPLDLAEVVAEEASVARRRFEAAKVELSIDVPRGLRIEADRVLLSKALQNLLDNGAKFTPAGGRVTVRAVRSGARAAVEVEDTGMGIPPDQQGKLFRPFSQAHDTMQRTDAGIGIGLYVARGILEQHGGGIEVASPGPGRGSTFRFWLPLSAA